MTLDELKRLSKEATPGPWCVHFETGIGPFIVGSDKSILSIDTNGKDLLFISEARNHIDKLLAVAEAAKELNEYDGHYADIDGKLFNNLSLALAALEDEK